MNKFFKNWIGIVGIVGMILILGIAFFSQDRTSPYVPNIAQATNSKLSIENENKEDSLKDAEIVAQVGEATLTFVIDSVDTIMEYINNDDYEGLIVYAYTCANSTKDIDTISDRFYEARNLVKTDKAKGIIDYLKYIFTDYMSILKNIGDGNISTGLNAKMDSVTQRINKVRVDIKNFYE